MKNSELLIDICEALDNWNPGDSEPKIEVAGKKVTVGRAIGQLWHDTNLMPNRLKASVADHFDPRDNRTPEHLSTYASGARVLKAAWHRYQGEAAR